MFIGPAQTYSATAGLATWAGLFQWKNSSTAANTQLERTVLDCRRCNCNCQLRKAPPTTIFSLFRHSKISIHLQKALYGISSLGLLRSQYTYEKLLYAGDSPSYLVSNKKSVWSGSWRTQEPGIKWEMPLSAPKMQPLILLRDEPIVENVPKTRCSLSYACK